MHEVLAFPFDGDPLEVDGAEAERQIESLADAENQPGRGLLAELARSPHDDVVGADREERADESGGRGCQHAGAQPRLPVRDHDLRFGERSAERVPHDAPDDPGRGLRLRGGRAGRGNENEQGEHQNRDHQPAEPGERGRVGRGLAWAGAHHGITVR